MFKGYNSSLLRVKYFQTNTTLGVERKMFQNIKCFLLGLLFRDCNDQHCSECRAEERPAEILCVQNVLDSLLDIRQILCRFVGYSVRIFIGISPTKLLSLLPANLSL